eukprot:m51a1_g5702 hypothetical protein (1182) ;mRNA; f:1033584-1061301
MGETTGIVRFFSQLRLLLWKNLLSSMFFLGLLCACSQIIVAHDDPEPDPRPEPLLPRCHSPLSGAACVTVLWAVDPPASSTSPPRPLDDAALGRVIGSVLRRNGLLESDAVREADSEALRQRILKHPNLTLSGVVFYPRDAPPDNASVTRGSGNDTAVPYALLWNETTPWPSLSTVDVFEAMSHSVQMAVVEELVGRRAVASAPVFTNSRFPQHFKVRKFDAMSNVGTLIMYCPTMFNFMLLLYQLVQEKDLQLRRQMKSVGMSDVTYWASHIIYNAAFITVSTLFTMAFGCVFQFAFFIKASWPAVFLTFWLFGLAMMPLAAFISMLVSNTQAAVNAGMAVFLFGIVVQIIATNNWLLTMMYSPDFPQAALNLLCLWPPFPFSKLIIDIAGKTNENDLHKAGAKFFTWSDMYEKTLVSGGYFYPSPMESVYWLLIDLAWFTGVALILFSTLPSENGWLTRLVTAAYHRVRGPAKAPESVSLSEVSDDSDVKDECAAANSSASKDAVRLMHFCKTYKTGVFIHKSVHAVTDLNMTVKENEIVVLLGHNGCGKSTTMNALSCVVPMTSGDAMVYGKSVVNEPSEVRKMIGVCPQDDVLWPDLTAIEHLQIFGLLKGLSFAELKKEVRERLEEVSLWHVGHRAAGTFSGGMKRRLTVAISCIGRPKLLLLDEPTTGLDPVAQALGDRVAIMSSGSIRCIAPPLKLKSKYGVGYVLHAVSPNGREAEASAYVRKGLPAAVLMTKTSGDLKFAVPAESIDVLSRFLLSMEQCAAGMCPIKEWGVSQTTLEEVFLRVAYASSPWSRLAPAIAVLHPCCVATGEEPRSFVEEIAQLERIRQMATMAAVRLRFLRAARFWASRGGSSEALLRAVPGIHLHVCNDHMWTFGPVLQYACCFAMPCPAGDKPHLFEVMMCVGEGISSWAFTYVTAGSVTERKWVGGMDTRIQCMVEQSDVSVPAGARRWTVDPSGESPDVDGQAVMSQLCPMLGELSESVGCSPIFDWKVLFKHMQVVSKRLATAAKMNVAIKAFSMWIHLHVCNDHTWSDGPVLQYACCFAMPCPAGDKPHLFEVMMCDGEGISSWAFTYVTAGSVTERKWVGGMGTRIQCMVEQSDVSAVMSQLCPMLGELSESVGCSPSELVAFVFHLIAGTDDHVMADPIFSDLKEKKLWHLNDYLVEDDLNYDDAM